MSGRLSLNLLLRLFVFLHSLHEYKCMEFGSFHVHERNGLQSQDQQVFHHQRYVMEEENKDFLPNMPPAKAPQPFLPLIAPSSPLAPYKNNTPPRLSGLCTLNFSAAESMISTTAVDCWASVAPFLANVICCPQLQATLVILIGQSGKYTGNLALNVTQAMHCLSDIQEILKGQGANENLQKICPIHPSNLTEGSCPVKDTKDFERVVDSATLLVSCEKVDPVNECCSQICQNAISEAAKTMALRDGSLSGMRDTHILRGYSSRINDCKSIVLRWLASKLHPLPAKQVLRRISNCNLNKFCPLFFPDIKYVAKQCSSGVSDKSMCCNAMAKYVSHLQKQSLITNLQALDCAALLGAQLQKMNVTDNLYDLCHVSLKDFSLQVGSQESGCLLPSLPSDVTFDQYSGLGFTCDLNDNIAAPWPSASQQALVSSCNKTVKVPALPAATTSGIDHDRRVVLFAIFSCCLVVFMLL